MLPNKMRDITCQQIECVQKFIDEVWNDNSYGQISKYLHEEFVDYSMPYEVFQNQSGLLLYLNRMSETAHHRTEILNFVTMDELVICKIRIFAAYLDDKDSTKRPVEVVNGYRIFKMHENKIIAHWEML